jgi:hypothetical protein
MVAFPASTGTACPASGAPERASEALLVAHEFNVIVLALNRQWDVRKMLAFIDESGDPGQKLAAGSSLYFTIAVVFFHDRKVAAACDRRIAGLRKELKAPEGFEFHFSKTSDRWREAFLRAVSAFEFGYVARTIDKRRLKGKAWKDRKYFYQEAARLALEAAKPYLLDAKVLIDRSNDRTFDQELAKYLKKHAGTREGKPVVREVRSERSDKHNLIQIADMVCGAVARSYHDEKASGSYRRLIQAREVSAEIWPG